MPIADLIRPIKTITSLTWDTPLKELPHIFDEYSFSRFPVYYESKDNIIGFVHVKDIYKSLHRNGTHTKLSETKLVKKTINVSANQNADEILENMQEACVHLAVMRDKHGETLGIVTMEDIFENLVGEIKDEFDLPGEKVNHTNHNQNHNNKK